MALLRGSDVVVLLDTNQFPILCARSVTFDIQTDMIETSVKGAGKFRTYVPGAISWTGTIEGLTNIQLYDEYNLGQAFVRLLAGDQIFITWVETDGTNTYQKQGIAYIESINETSSFDNMATFTITFRGTSTIEFTGY